MDSSSGIDRVARRILIADDSASGRELLRSILEASGYEVAEAEHGQQVMEMVSAFQPHLLILDLQMPRLDGCAAAVALKKMPLFESTPIIALTAGVSSANPDQIAAAGFSTYLVKPISPTRLRQCVADLL